MLKFSKWGILGCLAATVAMTGCGDGTDFPDTAKVTGIVTYNGAPLPGALVTFAPSGEEGAPATAITGATGSYSLSTYGIEDGAVPASYGVTISKMSQSAQGDEGTTADNVDAAYLAMEAQGIDVTGGSTDGITGSPVIEAQDLIPAKYKDKATSGFTADVPKDGATFDFDLQ